MAVTNCSMMNVVTAKVSITRYIYQLSRDLIDI